MLLNEFTKSELVSKSKTPGFNRYTRRLSVKPTEVLINKVVVGKVSSSNPHLDVYFKVRDYICSIRLINFMLRVRVLRSRSKYRRSNRKMLDLAFDNTLKNNDLLIKCTCPDFYYRFSYSATVNNYGFNTDQLIPAKIRNPNNLGSGCKHLMRIINAPSLWKSKVITGVNQAINADPSILGGDLD